MKNIIISLFAILLISTPVIADQPNEPELKLEDGLVQCFKSDGSDIVSINECMSFGLISIGDKQSDVVELLGNPEHMLGGVDTAQIGIYNLTPTRVGETPYLIVTISNETVSTLLMQGYSIKESFSFNGIALGDSASTVKARFGSPSKITRNEEYGSELWNYESYPFSFEIENDLVMSIMIWMDDKSY